VIRDSVAHVVGSGTAGIQSASPSLELRNVTVVAAGPSSQGIRALDQGSGTAPAVITARNVIARGESSDVRVYSIGSFGAVADMAFSNYRGSVVTGDGATVVDSGHNQSSAPLFADERLGDYHQLAGSPTIDAGTDDALNGATDFDGEARWLGAAPDIGADELAYAGSSGPPPGPGGGSAAAPDRTAPVVSRLRVRPRSFRARKGAKAGYLLSESATVTFRVQRRAGRRWKAAGRALRKRAAKGGNGFRLRARRLRPGRYRLVASAVDAAGNRSKAARTRFRIVR
jgi:hypothetical protein